MDSPSLHIGLIYDEAIPEVLFEEFTDTISAPGLDLTLQARPGVGIVATPEWLIPTAVIVFITQGYFNGFLEEVGKDHYALLKQSLKKLRERFSYVKVTLIGSPGKVSKEQPYSLAFSIYFEDESRTIKFLTPAGEGPDPEIDRVMDVFAEFLATFYEGTLEADYMRMLKKAPALGGTLLVAYNPDTGRIETVHPATHLFGA